MEEINNINENENLSKYAKTKKNIYKWRENNKEKYLNSVSKYNLNRYDNLDEVSKKNLIDKIKANVKARRELKKREKEEKGEIPKKGRPRKHNL